MNILHVILHILGATMQIDFHYGATYVLARLAGFPQGDAEIIAHSAQYVDDATNGGSIRFEDSEYMHSRIASAHSMIDRTNLIEVDNHLAWLPFHFLPGNGGSPAESGPEGELDKLQCKPDSHVARDMLRAAAQDRESKRGLHRLGIAMHVYADTFAHQGFVGGRCKANQAQGITSGDSAVDEAIQKLSREELKQGIFARLRAFIDFVTESLRCMIREGKSPIKFYTEFMHLDPLGHAAADTFPDQPYLAWRYMDWMQNAVHRDNPETFLDASDMMVRAMHAWRAGDTSMRLENHAGLNATDRVQLEKIFRGNISPDGKVRILRWHEAIASGAFSFGVETLKPYIAKGEGSWKEAAVGTRKPVDTGYEAFSYSPAFLDSHWKLFHDAIQSHRSDVVREILPRYNICAA